MKNELEKTLIRIILDHCFSESVINFCDRFALYLGPQIRKLLEVSKFNSKQLAILASKRKDFFIANDLDVKRFCASLYDKLKYELEFTELHDFFETIVNYKRKMENGRYRGFEKDKINEDTLRNNLSLYIRQENFCEPRAGAGFCDIIIPSLQIIIETKLWKGIEYYKSGFPELDEYLDKNNYDEGYYVIYDYNILDNEIIKKYGEFFSISFNNKKINVFFIKMKNISPSQKYKHSKN